MSSSKTWNPVRGTMWLPQDVSDLHEIDFSPLPEDGNVKAQAPLIGAEPAGTSLEAA